MKKKLFGIALVIFCVATHTVFADEEAVSDFENDFESYILEERYVGDVISNGKPVDGDYSDTAVYPNGEKSVYEGNAASNLFVLDSKNNKVYGPLDGWVGYYLGTKNANYNKYNRRLAVRSLPAVNNKVLSMEPYREEPGTVAYFGKENIDFSGLSIWETDISITAATAVTSPLEESYDVSFWITKNPTNPGYKYENSVAVVSFKGNTDAVGAPVDIYFMGKKLDGQFNVSDFYANSQSFVNVKYILDTSGDITRHWVEIRLDGEIIARSEAEEFPEDEFSFTEAGVFGILYSATGVYSAMQPRVLLDNIKFYKKQPVQISNKTEIESTEVDFNNMHIDMKIDAELTDESLSAITMTDMSGESINIECSITTDGIRVVSEDLKPKTTYKLYINGMSYDGCFKMNDSVIFRTKNCLEIVKTSKKISGNYADVDIEIKNNTSEQQSFVAVLAVNDEVNHYLNGIYCKFITIPAGETATVKFENIAAPQSANSFIVYTVNNLMTFNALSSKELI